MFTQQKIETEHLVLRRWKMSDAAALYDYARDERVGPNAGWPAHKSMEESRIAIRNILRRKGTYAVTLKEEKRVIGSIGLHDTEVSRAAGNKALEVGYVLSADYWGHGYMPEALRAVVRHAFLEFGLDEVWCAFYDYNERSRRVTEKVGFEFVGEKRTTLEALDSRPVTEILTHITREQFFALYHET